MRVINNIKCYGELEKSNKDGFYSIRNNNTIEGYLYDELISSKFGYVNSTSDVLNGFYKIVNRTVYILCGDILNKRVYEYLIEHIDEFDTIVNPWGTNIPNKIKHVHKYWFNKGKDIYSFTGDDIEIQDFDHGLVNQALKRKIPSYHHNDIDVETKFNSSDKQFWKKNHKCTKFYNSLEDYEIYYLTLLYNYITVDNIEYHIGNCSKRFIVKEI